MNHFIACPRTREEQNQWVMENINLLHSVAHSFQHCGLEYDDLFQEVCEGAVKAMITYDPRRGAKLSTYVVDCAENRVKEVLRMNRTQSRTAIVVSLEQSITPDGDERSSLLNMDLTDIDMLHDESVNLTDIAHTHFLTGEALSAINELPPAQRKALLMYAEGYSQQDIAKAVGLSQGNVSKMIRIASCEVRLRLQDKGLI